MREEYYEVTTSFYDYENTYKKWWVEFKNKDSAPIMQFTNKPKYYE